MSGPAHAPDPLQGHARPDGRFPPEPLEDDERERYLQLPEGSRRVAELARTITTGARTERERAERILVHLRDEGRYRYTLEQPFTGDRDPLEVFLFVHFCVHVLSLVWSLASWSTLDKHMRDFRRREGNTLFIRLEWLYEQSDTALYFVLAMKVLSTLPPGIAMALVMATSILFATTGPKRWFGKPETASAP